MPEIIIVRHPSVDDIDPKRAKEEITLDKQLENNTKKDTYYNRKRISDAATLLIIVVMYAIPICALILAIILIIDGQINKVIDGFTYIVVFIIGSIVSPHLKNLMNIPGAKEREE